MKESLRHKVLQEGRKSRKSYNAPLKLREPVKHLFPGGNIYPILLNSIGFILSIGIE